MDIRWVLGVPAAAAIVRYLAEQQEPVRITDIEATAKAQGISHPDWLRALRQLREEHVVEQHNRWYFLNRALR